MSADPAIKPDRKPFRNRFLHPSGSTRRGVIYTGLMILIASIYTLLVSGLVLILGKQAFIDHILLIGVVLFISMLVFLPVRDRLHGLVSDAFSRKKPIPGDKLQTIHHRAGTCNRSQHYLAVAAPGDSRHVGSGHTAHIHLRTIGGCLPGYA